MIRKKLAFFAEESLKRVTDIITVENDLCSRQFLVENFFRIAARSIISLDKRTAFSK